MTAFVALVMTATACPCQAGGLLTNTNQNVAFLRNPARDGVIAIDGVYSNPAGVAFLPNGLHISLNNQSAFQTRIINSGMSVPGLEGTPYYHPLSMNGGDENGVKQYKGEASAPIVPSFQVAWNHDKWGFQMGFALVGGGGKCTFNEGLGSFERQIALLPAVMQQTNQLYQQQYGIDLGLGTDTPGYSVESYMHGQQYIFGLQLGATYKLNEHLAVYGGFRFNYILNKYKGSIQNISVNVGGAMENLHQFLGNKAAGLTEQAAQYQTQATTYAAMAEEAMAQGNTQLAQQLGEAAQQLTQAAQLAQGGAQAMESTQGQVADKRLECTQRGWAIAPIIGIDWKWEKLNIGARYEFPSQCNIQNDTKVDDTGLFADGVNTPGDIPALFTIGAQYELLSNLRLMSGYHLFFDKDADMADAVTEETLDDAVSFVKGFAESAGCIIAVTGAIDLVSDGKKCYVIRNGRPEMGKVTGTGCQLSGIMTAYLTANPEHPLEAAAAAVCVMGLAGEIGWKRMQEGDGNAAYRNRIIDAIYNMTGDDLEKGAIYELR